MTIFDVSKLTEEECWDRARSTLARHPRLANIYDDTILANLIRRRQSSKNHLLFWLVLPVDDDKSIKFWSPILEDLSTLEHLEPLKVFRKQMRHEEKEKLASWRAELFFGAWLVRNGIAIALEPDVGGKHPEFVTETDPRTWWEIKTPLEIRSVRDQNAVYEEVRRLFREIPEPYVIHVLEADLDLADVAGAARNIKSQIRAFHEQTGEPPVTFQCSGLVIKVGARTQHRPTGFLGTTTTGYVFGDEHAIQTADKISSAVAQLPKDGAAIVVINRTLSDWSEETDAINGCYGSDSLYYIGGQVLRVRGEGLFRPSGDTRISAVVSYSAHAMHWENSYEMLFMHNPFAKTPLPEDLFRFHGVRHMRRVDVSPGRFRLDVSGNGIKSSD